MNRSSVKFGRALSAHPSPSLARRSFSADVVSTGFVGETAALGEAVAKGTAAEVRDQLLAFFQRRFSRAIENESSRTPPPMGTSRSGNGARRGRRDQCRDHRVAVKTPHSNAFIGHKADCSRWMEPEHSFAGAATGERRKPSFRRYGGPLPQIRHLFTCEPIS